MPRRQGAGEGKEKSSAEPVKEVQEHGQPTQPIPAFSPDEVTVVFVLGKYIYGSPYFFMLYSRIQYIFII